LEIVAALLCCVAGVLARPAWAAANAQPKFAVLEFDGKGASEPWAAGLGDLLELSFQKQGAELFTRRFIALVLNERRAQRSGLIGDSGALCSVLPGVEFLVKGSVSQTASNRFALEVRVLDSCSGTEQRSFAEGGNYPAELVPALDRLAAQIARASGAPVAPAKPETEMAGFTKMPEVMVTFYQGLEHLMAGRPEYAVPDFDVSAKADPKFLVARLWCARAYEALGLEDHAAVEYAKLAAAETNLNIALLGIAATGRAARVVTVLFLNSGAGFDAHLAAQIKDGLRAEEGISLFAPDWMKDMADEGDLRLTGDFTPFAAMDRRVWLQSEYAVAFQCTTGTPQKITARVVSLATGRMLGTSEEIHSDTRELCRSVASAILNPTGASQLGRAANAADSAANLKRSYSSNGPEGFPLALVRYARAPDDRERINDLYGGYDREDGGHRIALMQRLWRGIIPGETNEAAWRLRTLWHLWDNKGWRGNGSSIQEHYAEFLDHFPGTLSAACAEYGIGMDLLWRGKTSLAQPYLTRAADRIRLEPGTNDDRAVVFFLPAYVNWKLGHLEDARRYMAMVNETLLHSDPHHDDVVYTFFVETVGSETHRTAMNPSRLRSWGGYAGIRFEGVSYGDLHTAYRWLDDVLKAGGTNNVTSLESAYREALESKGPDAIGAATRYFQRLLVHNQVDPNVAHRHRLFNAADLLQSLEASVSNDAFAAQCRQWAAMLAEQSEKNSPEKFSLLLVAGDWVKAREYADTLDKGAQFLFLGKIELHQHGRKAQAECYTKLGQFVEPRLKSESRIKMAMLTASAWSKAGNLERAREFYAKASLPPEEVDFQHFWLSAKYDWAALEHEAGEDLRAVELLKELTAEELSKTCEFAIVREYGDKSTTCSSGWAGNGKTVYAMAVELLENIRSETNGVRAVQGLEK
jgi:hypothetical protein